MASGAGGGCICGQTVPGKSYRRSIATCREHYADGSLAIADSDCVLQTTTRRRPESMMP